MKDKNPLAVGARCRVKDIEQLEGTVVSDTGIVVEESDAAVKVHHDHWPKDEWYLREQCRRLKPRQPKQEDKRREWWVLRNIVDASPGAFFSSRREAEGSSLFLKAGWDLFHLVELRENEVLVDRAKLEKAWDKNGCNKNIYPLHDHSEFFDMLCTALGLKGQP